MSKEFIKACSHKMSFKTQKDAQKHLKTIRARPLHRDGHKDPKKLRYYCCPKCGEYHMTSMGKNFVKRLNRKSAESAKMRLIQELERQLA